MNNKSFVTVLLGCFLSVPVVQAEVKPHALFSENAMLQDTMSRILGQMGRYQMRSVALRGSLRRSIDEHSAILMAVRAGDADEAARLLGEHIQIPQRRLEAAPDDEVVLRDAS